MGLATGAIITGILGGLFAGHTAAYSKKKQLEKTSKQSTLNLLKLLMSY